MLNSSKPLSSSAIKYLLVLSELCVSGQGARCKDIAARMSVSKPSAHSMIQNLCDLGLAEKQKYGGPPHRAGQRRSRPVLSRLRTAE